MNDLIKVIEIFNLQRDSIERWKTGELALNQHDFFALVEENHVFNYQLWHAEDKARRDDMGYEFVYKAKREIDHYNQQRNNRMEAMDEWFFNALQPSEEATCPVHSETPGMMIDRLSILALKAYHMDLQRNRQGADAAHHQNCLRKWQIIVAQQNQLVGCLQQLIHEVRAKTRPFKVYHQFKMYNDPALNPQLYKNSEAP